MNQVPHRWCSFVVCLVLLIIVSVQPAKAGVTEWMDIQVINGNLVVETEVAGIIGQSIIDTGSTITAVNANFLEAEGLSFKTGRKVTIEGVFGRSRRSTYLEVPGAIFGAPVTFSNLVDLELGSPDVQLLLGANFFRNHIFQFDYTNERMRLMTRDAVDLKAIKNVDAKKDTNSGALVVRANMDEEGIAWLLMDTGAAGGLLIDRKLANRLGWIDAYPSVDGVTTGVISGSAMEYFRVPSIGVGPFNIENVLVSIPAEGESPKFFESILPTGSRIPRRNAADGILGYDVLKHFVVTIDYDRGYVHFYPGENIPDE